MELSILIVNWNTRDYLERCLQSIRRAPDPIRREVIVVDNASHDDSAGRVSAQHPGVRLVRHSRNQGYAFATNVAIELARGRHLLLLNPDTELIPGCLQNLVAYLNAHPGVGAVAPWLLNPDGSFQPYFFRFPTPRTAFFCETEFGRTLDNKIFEARHRRHYHSADLDYWRTLRIDQPPASCLAIKRSTLDRTGPLDERFPIFYNDVDLCQRIWKAGLEIHLVRDAAVIHHRARSTVQWPAAEEERLRSLLAYLAKHHGRLAAAGVRALLGLDSVFCSLQALRNRRRGSDYHHFLAERAGLNRRVVRRRRPLFPPIQSLRLPGARPARSDPEPVREQIEVGR